MDAVGNHDILCNVLVFGLEITTAEEAHAKTKGGHGSIRHVDTPKIALHMQGTDLHPKEPNPELPHVIPLVPGILHYVQESSEEL